MTRRALGRGLGALLSADEPENLESQPNEIELDLIDPNRTQPRSKFDEIKLQELAQSILANGLVQPLLVRKMGTRYELVAGERRWRAAQLAGLKRVPALIKDVPDEKVLELALIENIQREDLNAIEEAQAYKRLIDTVGMTQESLADRVGRDRSYITNYLRLLKLPEDLQNLVRDGKISSGHARTLLGLTDSNQQRKLARRIIALQLSVRDTERMVKEGLKVRAPAPRAESPENDANTRAAENKLRRHLGTQVRIVRKSNSEAGAIEIEFYDTNDLNRLYEHLMRGSEVRSEEATQERAAAR